MRRIAIVNQKGGCGKTTTSINLSGLFAKRALRTLLVDMDPQSHCAAGLAIPEGRIDLDIGDAMLADDPARIDPARLLWRVSRNFDLAPSRMKLAGLEAGRGGLADKPDKELRLAKVLDSLAKDYDLCCIDCSPSIGLLTFNALAAATEVLIPVETSYFSLQGAAKQLSTIRSLEKRLGVSAPCWLLPTMHDEASALARDLLDELRRRYGDKVLPIVIRMDPALKEAASFGQPVAEYSPNSRGAADYGALADWLAARAGLAPVQPPTLAPVPPPPAPTFPTFPLTAPTPLPLTLALPAEVHIVTEPDSTFALARRIAHAEAGAPALSPLILSPPGASPAAAVAVIAGPAPPAVAPSLEPQTPPPLNRAEDMLLRARKLVSRGEQLARRRGAQPAPVAPAAPFISPIQPALARAVIPAPGPRAAVHAPTLGVVHTLAGALFVQPLTIGRQVCIAGDFNNWSPLSHRLQPDPDRGIHELCIALPPGRRLYRLVVDGRWTADPFNPVIETNPFGEPNSVAVIPAPCAPGPPAGG